MMPRTLTEGPIKAKAFPLHTDTVGYFPDEPAMKAQIETWREMESVNDPMNGQFYPQPTYRRYYRKHKAQSNDPICLYYVLDLLVKQQRGTYIRPYYLTGRLNDLAPMYYWDNRSLGRLLSGLNATAMSEYDIWDDPSKAPFAKGRDAKGTYYVIDPMGGSEGLAWLLNARKRVMQIVEGVMRAEAAGDLDHSLGAPERRDSVREWIPGDLYSEAWLLGTRVRDKELYFAQCDGEPFYRSAPTTKVDRSDPFA